MIFEAPSWLPRELSPPDSIPISEFIFNEKYGRRALERSRDPFTCGLSGKTYSAAQVMSRIENLACALAQELKWQVNIGSEYDKVASVFCLNTIDSMTISWAIHRLNGISCPANSTSSPAELATQLQNSRSQCIFTCTPLLSTAVEAARLAHINSERIYVCDVPGAPSTPAQGLGSFRTLSSLILQGDRLPVLDKQIWSAGQGARQTAFLCYSSGTSGLPKGVQISHHNVISNVMQKTLFDAPWRQSHGNNTEICIGALPFSHIYGLVIICHTSAYRGDQVIVLPKYSLPTYLAAIQQFRVSELFVVPPIVIELANNLSLCRSHDLSSVQFFFSGAAPLSTESVLRLQAEYPNWTVCQAYGLTESSTVVTAQSRNQVWPGSSGPLLPGTKVKIVAADGTQVTKYNSPGEIWVHGPNITLGYLDNPRATAETYIEDADGRWLKTGDEGEMRLHAESGDEHLWVVDRIKELIKVKGNQVAPAELEGLLLGHPAIDDCAVISIPDAVAGEAPKAYVVLSQASSRSNKQQMVEEILEYVRARKVRYKWIKEVEFIKVIPKSPSGKILRRLLRDQDRAYRAKL